MSEREIFCCACAKPVMARLTDGTEIYPHRPDLSALPFWRCDACGNFVGCHHKTPNRTQPLGNIPTKEIKEARKHIHRILDPLWMKAPDPKAKRREIYAYLSRHLGYQYDTGEIREIDEARTVYTLVKRYAGGVDANTETQKHG